MDSEFSAAYGLLANSFLARSQSPELIAHLDDFLKKRPDDLRAVVLSGNVYAQWKQFEKALDAYERYLSAKPDSPVVLNNLAFLYAEYLARPDRGLELARRARTLDPKSPEIADTLGWILFGRKEYPEAMELFKESATTLPGNGEVHYHLGLVSQKLGQSEIARAAFERAAAAPGSFPGKDQIAQRLMEIDVSSSHAGGPSITK